MNFLLWGLIVVCIVGAVLFYAAQVAMAILNGTAEIIIGASHSVIINWLGRKNRGCRARIPDALISAGAHIRDVDSERVALEKYTPVAAVLPRLETKTFNSASENIFSSLPHPTFTLDIDELLDICRMSPNPSFEPLWAILNQDFSYPVRPLAKPADPPPPPLWSPWRFEIPEPIFEPPIYEGRFSILNRFVYAVYKGESDRVVAARASKIEIEEATAKRNEQMKLLAAKAAKLWGQIKAAQEEAYSTAMSRYNQDAKKYEECFRTDQSQVRARWELTQRPGSEGLLARVDLALRTMSLPNAVPREAESRFDVESGIFIHEQRFPDLGALACVKFVEQKSGLVSKPVNLKERKEISAKLWPAICLRMACEITRLDSEGIVKAVAINGWAEYTDKATGQRKRAYCASLFATKEQISTLRIYP